MLIYSRFRYYTSVPARAVSTTLPPDEVPHVTILRPVKSPEPKLYDCLAATFRQAYPSDKLTTYLCISSRSDPALSVLERLLADFPNSDAKILVEDEDPYLDGAVWPKAGRGPNPKIRNISQGYREAKGDIIWVLDCNIWVAEGVAGRMVDQLCGLNPRDKRKYKFVHQLPLVISTRSRTHQMSVSNQQRTLVGVQSTTEPTGSNDNTSAFSRWYDELAIGDAGGKLEEVFMASSHAKFYTAINTVLLAPCIIGKSNMFRRSHLDHLTSTNQDRAPGVDSFSDNICEDHLIGDLLWKKEVPEEKQGERWGKHALVFGDLAIQPMTKMSLQDYVARRVRWLRVRKYTVTLATFVEPGTESFLSSVYGAYAVTVLAGLWRGIGSLQSWLVFAVFWVCSVAIWASVDWTLYLMLRSASSIEINEHTPQLARPLARQSWSQFREWALAWFCREALAFPIWAWAVYGGATVEWRGKHFWVSRDMKVHALQGNQRTALGIAFLSRNKWKRRRD